MLGVTQICNEYLIIVIIRNNRDVTIEGEGYCRQLDTFPSYFDSTDILTIAILSGLYISNVFGSKSVLVLNFCLLLLCAEALMFMMFPFLLRRVPFPLGAFLTSLILQSTLCYCSPQPSFRITKYGPHEKVKEESAEDEGGISGG